MIKQCKPLLALALAAILAACGGSDDDQPVSKAAMTPGVASVLVVGDSFSDSGTFYAGAGTARSFTVQGSDDEPDVLWVERIAAAHGQSPLCAAYRFSGRHFIPGPPDCTNYAAGGARINKAFKSAGIDAPPSITRQLRDAAARGWQRQALLVVEGGVNDAIDLVTAYLGVAEDGVVSYDELLASVLPLPIRAVASESTVTRVGRYYMRALADVLAGAIGLEALDRGVEHVVVANLPSLTLTPRFQAILAQVEAEQGTDTRAAIEALAEQWVNAFNDRLAAHFAGDARVVLVDLARGFQAFFNDPERFGLTNVTVPLCGADSVSHLYGDACTADALTALAPNGGPGHWWERYLFADSFHPTPYGHQLMAEQALDAMASAGWD